MKTGIGEAALLTAIMAAVIFFCRSCAFLFFRGGKPRGGTDESDGRADGAAGRGTAAFLDFVEKTAPPLAMTVLTFNSLTGPIHEDIRQGIPVLIAAAFTVIVHLWRRNPLISIFGGTAVYMALERIVTRHLF